MKAPAPAASTLRRVRIHRPGGWRQLAVEPFESAEPPPGQVRVRVRAIGVNFADTLVRMGVYAPARHYAGWPITPGFEVAGEIDAVGPGLDASVLMGRRVVALTRFGAYAESVCVDHDLAFALPLGWTMALGAGFAVAALTARHALDLADAPAGARVLVHSAAGGVGHWLVQLATRAGLEVTGTVGDPAKRAGVLAGGARHCLVRGGAEDRACATRFRAVFDAQGPSSWRHSSARLAPMGRLVVYGAHGLTGGGGVRWLRAALELARRPRFDALRLCADNRGVLGFNLAYLFDERAAIGAAMAELIALVDGCAVSPPPITTLPFTDVAEAHRRLESGRTVGKLVLLTGG